MKDRPKLQNEKCKMKIKKVSGARCQVSGSYLTPETRNPTPRVGLSLTEVLIAMGILTLGLLGVASVFPVGSYYMQQADIADRGSAIAQSVMNDIMSRGMLNPRAWYVMTPKPKSVSPNVWNTVFPSDGKYSPSGTPQDGTFTRPFGTVLGEALNQSTAATDKTLLAKQFGSAYVIDPIGLSVLAFRNGTPPTQTITHGPAAVFPATAYYAFPYYAGWAASAWSPWSGGSAATANGYTWPVRRVTFRQPSSGWQMDATLAEHYFRGSDDLATDLPTRDDRPGIQNWDKNGQTPLARQWTGDYSWMVTVAPGTNAARDGMASNPEGFSYDVSVVVFYKRLLPDNADSTYLALGNSNSAFLSAMGANERAVRASVFSTGLNGGELLLTDMNDVTDANGKFVSAFDQLKTGQWIMLCGPHPNSNVNNSTTPPTGDPKFALNWYQVLSIDKEGTGVTSFDPNTQRIVAVRGAQWPWQPAQYITTKTDLANDLCVAICKGAVAVHTKSIRLESGISEVTFNNAGGSTTTQPPYKP
jgi:Tfp pilus assembly protein PilV